MDKIPNGGFPPLQLKETINKKSNKERFIATDMKKNVNIRQILLNNQKTNIFEEKKDNDTLEEIDTL